MDNQWYYVLDGERQGPVTKEKLSSLYRDDTINSQDYVWCKGMTDWTPVGEVSEFNQSATPDVISAPPSVSDIDLLSVNEFEKKIYIKIGADRGVEETEYGPYSLETIKKLYKENRINGKTFVFIKGYDGWKPLGSCTGFKSVFNELPPVIEEKDKRAFKRKPLIARMFISSNDNLFEGICRDLSIGGMQVLIDGFPGKIGDEISINVHPENEQHHFVASGKVVRLLDGGHGFSFRFKNLGEEAITAINKYIGE